MKSFLKYTLATVVGIMIVGVILTVVSVSVMTAALVSSGSETKVHSGSVFVLELDGSLVERSEDNPMDMLLGNASPTSSVGLDDVLASIKKAKENDRIMGMLVETGEFSCPPASAEAIRAALLDFKESGKWLLAYSGTYYQTAYWLASAADKVVLNPNGTISWCGLAGQVMYYKGLLDKLGVDVEVFRVGSYKSAVEPYISQTMSDANREQIGAYLGSIWSRMTADVASARGLSEERLNELADKNMDLVTAEECVSAGLADTLMYKDEMKEWLKQLTDAGDDDPLYTLYLDDMKGVKRNVPKDMSGNILAVYYAVGNIDMNTGGLFDEEGIDSEVVTAGLRALRKDDNVKAVVFRVNSPGGSSYGSEQIWREICLLKEKKPVIVSMGDYAASGGYYISCAADTIVAEATTLTGSIGVFGVSPTIGGLLKKAGINVETVKTNRLSDIGNMSRPSTDEEKALVQRTVNTVYDLFTRRCADGRGMSQDSIKMIAEGRVWTGAMAKDLNLVDEIGGLDKAIDIAAQKAGIENYSIVNYPEKKSPMEMLVGSAKEKYISTKLKGLPGECYRMLQLVGSLEKGDRIQALMPYVVTVK